MDETAPLILILGKTFSNKNVVAPMILDTSIGQFALVLVVDPENFTGPILLIEEQS